MRFYKAFLGLLAVPLFFVILSLPVQAAGFDPEYYAAKYPDVVAVYGTDTDALYQHYKSFGKKEGRYENAEAEAAAAAAAELAAQQIAESGVAPVSGYTSYVDIDIDRQLVTVFKDGEAVYQASCVSGDVSRGDDTPKGVFTIVTHTPGKWLNGPTWHCWVDYWMRLSGTQCGLHDASWRTTFGGNIYKTNGSHGCLNLSHADAAAIFNIIDIGWVAIVH